MKFLAAALLGVGTVFAGTCSPDDITPSITGFPTRFLNVPLIEWSLLSGGIATEDDLCAYPRFDFNSAEGSGKRAVQIEFCVTSGCPFEDCNSGVTASTEVSMLQRHSGLLTTPVGVPKGTNVTFGFFPDKLDPTDTLSDVSLDVTVIYEKCGKNLPINPQNCPGFSEKRFLLGLYPSRVIESAKGTNGFTNNYQFSLSGALTCPTFEIMRNGGKGDVKISICVGINQCPGVGKCDFLMEKTVVEGDEATLFLPVPTGNGLPGGMAYVSVLAENQSENNIENFGKISMVMRDHACAPPNVPEISPSANPSNNPSNNPSANPSANPSKDPERKSKKSHKKAVAIGLAIFFTFAVIGAVGVVASKALSAKKARESSINVAGGYAPMIDPSFD